jgi:RNA polymerase sigma factor (sigma-70 family)
MDDLIDIGSLISPGDQYTRFEQAETERNIREVISELPLRDQEIIRLWLDGLSISEIAERLDMPQSTVSSIRARALAALRNDYRIFTLGM